MGWVKKGDERNTAMKIGEQDDFFKVQKIKTEFQVLLEGIRMRNTVSHAICMQVLTCKILL